MRLHLGHWLLAALLAVLFHAAILIGWRAPVSSMTAKPRGPTVEMATSLAGIMGHPVEMREIKAPPITAEAKPPDEMREVEPDRPDTVTDQKPFEVAATAPPIMAEAKPPDEMREVEPNTPDTVTDQKPFEVAVTAPVVIPENVTAAEPLPMVPPTEITMLQAVPPTLKQVQPDRAKKTKPKELKSEPPAKEIKPTKKARKKPLTTLRAQQATRRGTSNRGQGGRAKEVKRASSSSVRDYGRQVRSRIMRRTRGGGGSGTVLVSFGVSRSGGLRYARVVRSSGKKYLDRRALAAVRGSYPRAPKGASESQLRFSIAITFR